MTKKTTRKLPQYLQELNGRYFARVPVKGELRPYIGGTQLREPLGPDLRTAKENLFYHVAVFKERIRKAAEEYERDTGKSLPLTTEPVDPNKLMLRHYRDIVSRDQRWRDTESRYATSGAVDEMLIGYLRDGMSGRLTDEQYYSILAHSFENLKVRFAPNARPGAEGFRELARLMCVAQYEGLSRVAERDDGVLTGEPEHPALIDAIKQDEAEQAADVEIREFDHWTFDQVLERREEQAALGVGGRAKSKATLEKYRVAQHDFEHFRRDKKVATITLANGEAWRDHMLRTGTLSRKTVHDKLTIIRSLMNEANRQAGNQIVDCH